jgi:hypothetical protein
MSTGTLNREPGISLGAQPVPTTRESASDLVEVWGLDSFPASDPPANW